MGKLQIKRGTTVPTQLAAGEPFFDGENLHVGKLAGTGGNQKIGSAETGATIKAKLEALTGEARLDASAVKNLPTGEGGGATTIVEWVVNEAQPTVDADRVIGNFVEGKKHLVTMVTVGDETVAVIDVINWVQGFTSPLETNSACCATQNDYGDIYIGTNDGHIVKCDKYGLPDYNFSAPTDLYPLQLLLINDYIFVRAAQSIRRLNATTGAIDELSFSLPSYLQTNFDTIKIVYYNDDLLVAYRVASTSKYHCVRIDQNGSVIATFANDATRQLDDVIVDNNGSVIIKESYGVNSYVRRFLADGTVDASFTPYVSNDGVGFIALDITEAGYIYMTTTNNSETGVKRLLADGSLDNSMPALLPSPNTVVAITMNYSDIILGYHDSYNYNILCYDSLTTASRVEYIVGFPFFSFEYAKLVVCGAVNNYWELSAYNILRAPERYNETNFSALRAYIDKINNLIPSDLYTNGSIVYVQDGSMQIIQPPTVPSVLKHSGEVGTAPFWEAETGL